MNCTIDYDEENDILYIATGQKASDSIDFDDFVIDYSKDGMITGVEIMKSTEFIGKFGLSKEFLAKATSARMSVVQGREYALIKIAIISPMGVKEIQVPSPVPQAIVS